MTKQSAIKQLDAVIGKLVYLQANISGPAMLSDAANSVAEIRDRLRNGTVCVKHLPPRFLDKRLHNNS